MPDPTYLLVSVADPQAPIINRLWETRLGGTVKSVDGLRVHALFAYNPLEEAEATKDALQLVIHSIVEGVRREPHLMHAADWMALNRVEHIGFPPGRFLRALGRLRALAHIGNDTLTEIKELISHG